MATYCINVEFSIAVFDYQRKFKPTELGVDYEVEAQWNFEHAKKSGIHFHGVIYGGFHRNSCI